MRVGPQFKIARRLGDRIFPKTQGTKFTVSGTEKKSTGKKSRRNMSEFGRQLIEKQKARYTYGVSEKQFSNYIKNNKAKKGDLPTASLYKGLETRLDNVVFRMGLVNSRAFARQAVSHGHITVNGRKVSIPSYAVRVDDKIGIRSGSKDNGVFRDLAEKMKNHNAPNWLSVDKEKNIATVVGMPSFKDREPNLNFEAILEFYSRV